MDATGTVIPPSYFFKVEHELLRSDSFRALSGSAIKVWLIIGMHSDFGTGWAYPSIRTIAALAGVSRQTVLTAVGELAERGLIVARRTKGKRTTYRIIPQIPPPEPIPNRRPHRPHPPRPTAKLAQILGGSLPQAVQNLGGSVAPPEGQSGPAPGPEQDPGTRPGPTTDAQPIAGTPVLVTPDGDLVADEPSLSKSLVGLGLTGRLIERLFAQYATPDVARALLNALHMQGIGALQNPAGFIQAALRHGYELVEPMRKKVEAARRRDDAKRRDDLDRQHRAEVDRALEDDDAQIDKFIAELAPERRAELEQLAIADLAAMGFTRRGFDASSRVVRQRMVYLANQTLD